MEGRPEAELVTLADRPGPAEEAVGDREAALADLGDPGVDVEAITDADGGDEASAGVDERGDDPAVAIADPVGVEAEPMEEGVGAAREPGEVVRRIDDPADREAAEAQQRQLL